MSWLPIGIPWLTIYMVTAYFIWYLMIRLSLLGAWIYSKPGSIRLPQWIIIVLSLAPFCMEIISCILVVFALTMGFNPVHERHPSEAHTAQ